MGKESNRGSHQNMFLITYRTDSEQNTMTDWFSSCPAVLEQARQDLRIHLHSSTFAKAAALKSAIPPEAEVPQAKPENRCAFSSVF
jgi:hypothetical protein